MKRIIDETLKGRIERTISNTRCALQKIADAVSDMGKEVTSETLMKYAGNPYWERDEKRRQIDEECARITRTLGSTLMTDSIRSLLASKQEDETDYSSDNYTAISRCRSELEFKDFTAEDIIITEVPQTREVRREPTYEDIEKWQRDNPGQKSYFMGFVRDTEEYIWYEVRFSEDFVSRKLKGAERVLSNEECKEVYKLQQFANLMRHFKYGQMYSSSLVSSAYDLSDKALIDLSSEDCAVQWFCQYYRGDSARGRK